MKTHIILHHSLTKDSDSVSWGAIRQYHKYVMGWKDIGYHFGIENVGGEYVILVGRNVKDDAAAVREDEMNHKGIHICVVGNYDPVEPPIGAWRLAQRLCLFLVKTYDISTANIMGHRDFAHYKTCPGEMFNLNFFRQGVEEMLKGGLDND